MILRVIAICVGVAMICAALRLQHPEMATALSLAAGLVVLLMLYMELSQSTDWQGFLREMLPADPDISITVLKAAGIAVLSELGSQLCADSGERALAGRIALASRIAMLGLCAPLLSEIAAMLRGALQRSLD